MAIFRSLKTLIGRNRSCISRRPFFLTSLSISASSQSQSQSPSPSPPLPPLLLFRTSHFLSRLIVFPFHGPLFLSSPPWKLSQSATPLHFQSDALILPKKFHPFALLRPTTLPFPTKSQHEHRPIAFIDRGLPHSFLNLPNCISIARMVSGPVLGWMIINEWYLPAFAGLAISGATDWLDGFVARKMGINSVVGSYLDPLADKVLIGCVALAMVENNLLHPGLVGLVVLRDTLLVGGAFYNRASSLDWKWKSWSDFVDLDGTRPVKVEPLFVSKVNTVFQLILVAAALLQPELGTAETQAYINYLSWLVAGTTVASTAGYGVQYMRNRSLLTVRSH